MLLHFFIVGLGGAIGSMLRFGTGIISIKTFGVNFPWGTLTVNLVGSFCIGLLFGLSTQIQHFSEEVKLFLLLMRN
jgi:CrcB protein